MKRSLRDLLSASPYNQEPAGRVTVSVDLRGAKASTGFLKRCKNMGMQVEKVSPNKVVGSIDSEQIAALRADAEVREVEISRTLKPHSDE
jgi:hypothetical protein